ncbi:peptide-binding protein [Anopheles sinensis]|uniref:Peptide-binding protein n=1 Tax=Anopheles sinensis TaxID=74873 RepID=A0A084VBZ9_ANOSI|nr:peptide-binding protein [Anopheles sinensis]
MLSLSPRIYCHARVRRESPFDSRYIEIARCSIVEHAIASVALPDQRLAPDVCETAASAQFQTGGAAGGGQLLAADCAISTNTTKTRCNGANHKQTTTGEHVVPAG